MGLGNPLHIAILVLIVVLLFGARRLPELGRSLGAGIREFKGSIGTGDDATESASGSSAGAPTPAPAASPPAASAPAAQAPVASPAASESRTPPHGDPVAPGP
ncbi:MAG TPA: twin-arginine translocase TatA/TatE family subunit [Solirubrobacteraceae bacterium]|nr:twin-arginine translocase TatA/TatE family subunit [Solirubrobacteraceae bacterium]